MGKGDVLGVARIAGIMGAKRTADLIPLCHPLMITKVAVEFTPEPPDALAIEATVRTLGRTGVEMEALTAATVAALTVYDMCKAVDRGMRIEQVRLVHKAGGKSGEWRGSDAAAGGGACAPSFCPATDRGRDGAPAPGLGAGAGRAGAGAADTAASRCLGDGWLRASARRMRWRGRVWR